MAITITSREFNQNASKVLKMAEKEPVFITKWGKIVNVVSSYMDYQNKAKPQTLADVLPPLLLKKMMWIWKILSKFCEIFAKIQNAALWSLINVFAGYKHRF